MKMDTIKLAFISLIGTLCLVGACENLGQLYNLDLYYAYAESGSDGYFSFSKSLDQTPGETLFNLYLSIFLINLIGLIAGSILTVLVLKQVKYRWLIALGVFIFSYLLMFLGMTDFLIFAGWVSGVATSLAITALLLLAVGISLFLMQFRIKTRIIGRN